MKITLVSPINKYYVQTLCMIFFPGEKFGEGEEENGETPSLFLSTIEGEGEITAYARVKLQDKEVSVTRSVPRMAERPD